MVFRQTLESEGTDEAKQDKKNAFHEVGFYWMFRALSLHG